MVANAPSRFAASAPETRQNALQALKRDGAVILTGLEPSNDEETWKSVAENVPSLLWNADELRVKKPEAAPVHIEHKALQLDGKPLVPHTDGYMWGENAPDIVILFCSQPADGEGGANFLIDGPSVVPKLGAEYGEILKTVPVDHTERSDGDDGSCVNGVESINPVLQWRDYSKKDSTWWRALPGEETRMFWRRMVQARAAAGDMDGYISLWEVIPENGRADEVKNALVELDKVIDEEAKEAPRFCLDRGEALIVDNFRMLHARDGFQNSTRRREMWRVWSWTDACIGVPNEILTATHHAATILDAQQAMSAASG